MICPIDLFILYINVNLLVWSLLVNGLCKVVNVVCVCMCVCVWGGGGGGEVVLTICGSKVCCVSAFGRGNI